MRKILISVLFCIPAFGQSPIIPLQPKQQINQSFNNINTNAFYLDGKSSVCFAAGTANAITCPGVSVPTRLQAGMLVALSSGPANTGPVTLNVSGLGAKDVLSPTGIPLVSGQIAAGTTYLLSYNGTSYIMIGGSGNASILLHWSTLTSAQWGALNAASWSTLLP